MQTDRKKQNTREAIHTSDKVGFKIKAIKRDPEGHFTILKGGIHQEDINIYKYIFTQHRSTQVCKKNFGIFQERC